MSDFKTYMSLTEIEQVTEITKILTEFNIPFRIQDTSKDFDVSFSNNEAKNSFLIMLDQNDFDKASAVLEDKMKFDINEIDKQHPLFSFSASELKDVVKNYDEWHPFDVKLAKYLLEKQNIYVSDEEINKRKIEKEILATIPEKPALLTLLMGYTFCIGGGLAGIGIALFMLTGKKTLPNGSKKYIYSSSDRKHGIYMLLLGAICFSFFIYQYF